MLGNIRRLLLVLIAGLAAVMLTTTSANAAVNFRSGPTASDQGTQLLVTGNLSGLGTSPVTVTVTAIGTATVTCTNPAGNVAPGQNTTTSTTGTQSDIPVKNGRASFSVLTAAPVVGSEACPNSKWTATVTDVVFTSYTVTATQNGQVVLSETFQV
jgi:hypothetical protein